MTSYGRTDARTDELLDHNTLSRPKGPQAKITPTIYYQYIFDANNSIKASYSINTLYISFVLFAHMYYKDRLQAETGFLWFQDKNRLSLEIHANCFNMYLVVANKFSFKSGMINIYKFYNVELKLYWQIFIKS